MTKTLDRRDTFIVQSKPTPQHPTSIVTESITRTVRLPSGQRIHVVDRAAFDRAVRAATQDKNDGRR